MKIKVMTKEGNRKNLVLSKQLKYIEKQEQKLLNKKENAFMKSKITPVIDKIQDKIPDKLKTILDTAFYKGFQLVFEKGNAYIERTYSKDKIQLEYDLNNYAVDKKMSNKYIKKLDRQSNHSKTLNSSIAILEGGVLGLLGIGLPDIPLFIAVTIKTINEISLSYGYQYDTDEEKSYILYLICGAMTKGEKQKEFDEMIDRFGQKLNSNFVMETNLKADIKVTANILSEALLAAKFIQGIPFVGVIGGVVNLAIINKIGKYAGLKYKKRYLLSKVNVKE
jgi:hypothetical protein